jgi:hypothetical protein
MVEVVGSIPIAPTNSIKDLEGFLLNPRQCRDGRFITLISQDPDDRFFAVANSSIREYKFTAAGLSVLPRFAAPVDTKTQNIRRET